MAVENRQRRRGTRGWAIALACTVALNGVLAFGGWQRPGIASAAAEGQVKVQFYNSGRSETTQQPSPQFKLVNDGNAPVALEDVTLKYYFTADGDAAMAFDCWTPVGKENLNVRFVKLNTPVEGADHYLEIGFKSAAGTLAAGGSLSIVGWFNKTNWYSFTQTNDFSFNGADSSYVDWAKVPAFVGGELVWGERLADEGTTVGQNPNPNPNPDPNPDPEPEPEPEPEPTTPITVFGKTGTSVSTQMPSPEFEIVNNTAAPIELSDLKARYYFTIDGEKPLAIGFWSTVTKANVSARFVKMPIPGETADHYLEISFAEGSGTLAPGAKAGVYTWINKNDWSSFDQSNDHSFLNSGSMAAAETFAGYVDGALAWGEEPTLYDMPAFPNGIVATPSDNAISLTWQAVEGALGYDVEADGRLIENVQETSFTHNWLNPGTKHTYKVRARGATMPSVWSAPITLKTTGAQLLPPPENVRAAKTETSIALTWKALDEEITGYDVEIDGAVVDAGTQTSYTHDGLTSGEVHTYRVRAKDGATFGPWSDPLRLNTLRSPTGTFDVSFEIDPTAERAPISPYIYGTNDDLEGTENWTARRLGGNRLSTYNWENNASNAGADWHHSSDGYVPWYYGGVDWALHDVPGIGTTAFHEKSLAKGAYSLVTLQAAGYVAKDKNGPLAAGDTAPSDRWVEVKPTKGAPFAETPDTTDGYVYMDEFVNHLVNTFGPASSATGIKGYELDNEPGLWSETHPFMHPEHTGSAEVLDKGIALAAAVKSVDPTAETYGPVLYGFSEYLDMQASPDWATVKGNYDWYIDYYLDGMRVASAQQGKRLLDVLDLHWYPEVSGGGVRITNSGTDDNIEANKTRIQAPRSLWDASYTENSWIGTWYSRFLPLIPKLQDSIDTYNAGTKLAFTEYNYGGETHISGGIAIADVLGIFGKYGVHLGTYWKMVNGRPDAPYASAAFKIFNNYDGANGTYGDTKVKAETSDIENSSIYSSTFEDDNGDLHMIVINKNYDYDMNASFAIAGDKAYTSARVFAFDEASPVITERAPVESIEGNSFALTLPKLTVAHIVLSAE